MKKDFSIQPVSKRNTTIIRHLFPLLVFLLSVNGMMAQQVIGTFSYMNGGFEGQTAAALGTTVSPTLWSRQSQSGASSSIVTATPRTGLNYATVTNVATVSRGLQSPQLTPFVAGSTLTASTSYVIQYWIKNAATVAAFQLSPNTNGTSGTAYTTAAVMAVNSDWTKYTSVKSTASTTVTSSGIAIIGRSAAGTFDIDDVVIYAGTTADAAAPDAPTSPNQVSAAATQQTLSWSAPVAGVDGGGYMIVRSSADPTTIPNANGIYAVGNFVAGTEKVVYLGTATSFTDLGLSPSTTYYYRIYSVDKAFNYSSAATITASTVAPSFASEPTTQASGVSFASVGMTGLTINWSAGNGSNSLVVVKAGSAVDTDPTDGNSYTANTAFGSGTQIGSGNYVVYNGTGTSVTLTGLSKVTTYYVKVYTFNGSAGSENFLITSPASGNQTTLPGEISSNGTGGGNWNTAGSWAGGAVPTQYDNVTIAATDVMTFTASGKCYNLAIPTGTKVWAPAANTLQIYGTSMSCAGTFGDASNVLTSGSQLTVEFGGNLNISGAGGIYPYKLRPITGISNIGLTFDANVTVTAGGTTVMFDNVGNDNIYYTVNSPKTLNIANNLSMASSTSTPGTTNATLTINMGARVNVTGVFVTNVGSGKTFTGIINGTLAVTGNSTLYSTAASGGIATITVNGTYSTANLNITPSAAVVAPVVYVGSDGTINVNSTADFSSTTLSGYIANAPSTTGGTFTLGSGGTINLSNVNGLNTTDGPIRTSTRNLNTAANYSFVGTSPQVTGSDMPSAIANLTVPAAGLTLSKTLTVNGNLNSSGGGVLTVGANTFSLKGTNSGSSIDGANGTIVYIGDGAQGVYTLTNVNNLTVNNLSGQTTLNFPVTVNGTLTLTAGNINNSTNNITLANGATIVCTAGTLSTAPVFGTSVNLTYNGVTAQTASYELPTSSSELNNLTINNASGVALGASATANGTLTLTSGTLSLGANDLTIGSSGSISGASATNYIVTDGAGKLNQSVGAATAKLFPIGISTSSYDPATLTPTDATTFAANVSGTISNTPDAASYYNAREWNLTPAVASSTTIALTPSVVREDLVGFYTVIGHYYAGAWFNHAATKSGSTYTATTSLFSPFTTGTTDIAVGENSKLASKSNVYAANGQIVVENANGKVINVYSLTGSKVRSLNNILDKANISIAKGIYIISVDNVRTKVLVN